ncbi:MAG TPA: carboxypeptidase-like regulatory domain-containing protein [Puia sp.]|uniref:carboxypeptidase-like regulatory domain-containing protein n=1 Tax=Puia sp. TaxID=2045100 RepID=UPI002BBB785C|nr:carboxypeptidase-like regulatory domain-containing protein [Puia sp.]HVU99424.1 carboxypeptidase-like regulatory domain-containing protein [Puia sp.]
MKWLLILIISFTSLGEAQAQLTGTVTDSITGRPLAAVSVYLNNTSKGAVTNKDGTFRLVIPAGNYELVISAIGYTTVIRRINGREQTPPINIRLHQDATELTTITVEPYEKRGWGKYGKFFRENFIGTGANASSCEILNREVLRFHFYKRGNRLSVTATEPLQIANDALGYTLEYRLEEFVADFNNKITTWQGYPLFHEQEAKNKDRQQEWQLSRKTTYRGSLMHFIRSLYAGHTLHESFLIQRELTVPNIEKMRVKEIYRPDFQKPGLFPMDTLYHFWEVLRQPNMIQRRIAVSPDSLTSPHAGSPALDLNFDGTLLVTYGVSSRTDSFYVSGIRLLGAQPVTIEENGNYYPGKELLTTGRWGQSEKIGNLLPLDYFPPPPDPRYPGLH